MNRDHEDPGAKRGVGDPAHHHGAELLGAHRARDEAERLRGAELHLAQAASSLVAKQAARRQHAVHL